jgi:hypothetical protein
MKIRKLLCVSMLLLVPLNGYCCGGEIWNVRELSCENLSDEDLAKRIRILEEDLVVVRRSAEKASDALRGTFRCPSFGETDPSKIVNDIDSRLEQVSNCQDQIRATENGAAALKGKHERHQKLIQDIRKAQDEIRSKITQ